MSELAFNANGESFDVPANVTGWRVRRMKPRGAPELVYGRDGRPLMIAIDSEMEDLRDAVGQVGRYRLDPINEDGRTVEGVPAAYIQVVKPSNADAPLPAPLEDDGNDDAVREAMRLNTELARSVIDRFPDMMNAAAELLRAADGAGIPARRLQLPEVSTVETEDKSADEPVEDVPPTFDLNTIVAQLVPIVMSAIANGKIKIPGLGALFDWRKAVPSDAPSTEPTPRPRRLPKARSEEHVEAGTTATKPTTGELPAIDPASMAHFVAVQALLTAEESALAREVAQQLEPAELRSWFEELSKLNVPDAVARIRSHIKGRKKGGAS